MDAFRILLMRHFVRGDACQDPRGFLKLLRKRDAGLSGKNPKHPGLVMIILSVTHRVSRSWDLVMRSAVGMEVLRVLVRLQAAGIIEC